MSWRQRTWRRRGGGWRRSTLSTSSPRRSRPRRASRLGARVQPVLPAAAAGGARHDPLALRRLRARRPRTHALAELRHSTPHGRPVAHIMGAGSLMDRTNFVWCWDDDGSSSEIEFDGQRPARPPATRRDYLVTASAGGRTEVRAADLARRAGRRSMARAARRGRPRASSRPTTRADGALERRRRRTMNAVAPATSGRPGAAATHGAGARDLGRARDRARAVPATPTRSSSRWRRRGPRVRERDRAIRPVERRSSPRRSWRPRVLPRHGSWHGWRDRMRGRQRRGAAISDL